MKASKRALILALIAILCWSSIGSAFRLTLNIIPPPLLLFYALLTALLFTGGYILVKGHFRRLFQYSRRQYIRSALIALLNPFIYYLLLLHAYDILPTQVAGTINYIWPIILVILSAVVLKQKVGIRAFLACFISFSGLVLIVTRGDFRSFSYSDPLGVVFILCCSIFFALYWILNLKDARSAEDKLFLTYFFALLYLIPVLCFLPYSPFPPIKGLLGSIYIGIFEMGLTFLLWLKALQITNNTARLSNLVFLSPFISLFFISIFVGETIALSTFVGLLLIVLGILLSQTKQASLAPK